MGWFSTEAMDEIRNLFLKTVVQHIDELITLVEDNVAIDDSVPMDLTELQRSIEENSVIVDDAGDNCGINIESLPKYSYGPLQSQINLLHYYLTNDNFKSTGSVEPTKRKPNKIVNTKPKEVTAKPQKVGDIRNMEKTPAPLDLLEAAKSVVGFEIFDEEEDEFEDDSDQESDAYDSEYDEENDED